ncbi:MAG: hypothetical protein J7M29_02980 [Verrucomicrobia bacterium]|nr:hypothetical protein [Verrucomicrobiota bacterium]
MKSRLSALAARLLPGLVGLALAGAGCSDRREQDKADTLKRLGVELKEKARRGELTEEEAASIYADAEKREQQARIEALRADLRRRVAEGAITEPEAQVKLAEAYAVKKARGKDKKPKKASPELKALGAELMKQVKSGKLTEEEAKSQWIKAKKAENSSKR